MERCSYVEFCMWMNHEVSDFINAVGHWWILTVVCYWGVVTILGDGYSFEEVGHSESTLKGTLELQPLSPLWPYFRMSWIEQICSVTWSLNDFLLCNRPKSKGSGQPWTEIVNQENLSGGSPGSFVTATGGWVAQCITEIMRRLKQQSSKTPTSGDDGTMMGKVPVTWDEFCCHCFSLLLMSSQTFQTLLKFNLSKALLQKFLLFLFFLFFLKDAIIIITKCLVHYQRSLLRNTEIPKILPGIQFVSLSYSFTQTSHTLF